MTGKDQDQKNNYQLLKLLFEELDLPGLQELMTADKVENLFNRLYEEQGLQLVKAEQTVAGNTKPSFGTCPYCQSSIHEGETKVYCAECSIPHHEDCWLENGRCALFGCTGRQTLAEPGAYGAKKEQMVLELSELPPEEPSEKQWERIAHANNEPYNGGLDSYSDEFKERATPLWQKAFATIGNIIIIGIVIYFLVSFFTDLLNIIL